MKKLLSLVLCLSLLLVFSAPVLASEASAQPYVVSRQVIDLGDGITIIDEISVNTSARASIPAAKTRTITEDGVTIGIIRIEASFSFDGSSVTVISKSVTRTDTYEGWSYKQNSFTASGGTVTLDAKLTKLLVFNIPFTMTLSCDKNGNIS